MATLGTTTEPTSAQEWFGLNSVNHFALVLTMPAGGPWEISSLGAWLAGQSEVCNFKLCIWSSGGSLLASSATLTAASMAFALGNNVNYESAVGPIEVPGGASVHVGFARDPQDNIQFGTRSGSRKQWTSGSYPTSFPGSWSTVSAAIGAYINDYHSANVAPNAPVSLSPTGNAIVSSGTAPVVNLTRSDPDSGDYITAYQIVVYEDDGTTVIQDTGKSAASNVVSLARTLALNGAHKYVKWKARTWDKEDVAGPYSALQRFYANSVPATPGAPTVDVDDLTPDIAGSFTDSGDTLAAVQIEVSLNASPNTIMWSSGDLAKSGTSWSATYAGSALSWGVAYRARYRVKDSHGAYSSWSAYKTWTTTQPVGPDNNTPRTTNPRLSTLTPTLTVGHTAAQFKDDSVEVMTGPGTGTLLWTLPLGWFGSDYSLRNSIGHVYAGTALAYGGVYYWRSRVKLSDGTITSWSAWHPIRINATPSSPNGLTPTGGQALTTLTPTFTWKFADIDLDQGDTQATYTIEVRNNATDALINTLTGTTAQSRVYSGTALAYETTYKWRIKVTDAMGLESAYSSYQVFKLSQPPSAALTAPSSGSTVTESTPTLDWTFNSPGGKAQSSFQVKVYDKGPTGANYVDEELVHDSGVNLSTATQYDVPYGVLEDDHDYRWEVVVTDTDGLSYTLV